MSVGAGTGAALGVANSFITGNDTIMGGAISGGIAGGILGAGSRYASMKYTAGVSSFINSTVDKTSGKVFAGTRESLIHNDANFKFSHFARASNTKMHSNFLHPDSKGLKTVNFQAYNPMFTAADNPGAPTSRFKDISRYEREYY